MTDNEIIIELAKLDGLGVCPTGDGCLVNLKTGEHFNDSVGNTKRYLTSRDAIIPVIEKQNLTVKYELVIQLFRILKAEKLFDESYQIDVHINMIISTPRQLAIALLKATGKWKE